jgi:hypothetical protein
LPHPYHHITAYHIITSHLPVNHPGAGIATVAHAGLCSTAAARCRAAATRCLSCSRRRRRSPSE